MFHPYVTLEQTVYHEICSKKDSNQIFLHLFGSSREVIDSQIAICTYYFEHKKEITKFPTRIEDVILQMNHYAKCKIDLHIFAQSITIDSTPIEIEKPNFPQEKLHDYIHLHYQTTKRGHNAEAMPCICYSVTILPKPIRIDVLAKRRPDLLQQNEFKEWKKGLLVVLTDISKFNPQHYEGLCLDISDGYLKAVAEKTITAANDSLKYITKGLALVSDLSLQGQEKLLGVSRNRGSLMMKNKKPKNKELTQKEKQYNERFESFRKQIEDWNNKLKEFEIMGSVFRGNYEMIDYWVKFCCGLLNCKLFVENGLFGKIDWKIPFSENNEEIGKKKKKISSKERLNKMLHVTNYTK
ncbi:hypothetical protein ABK040_006281 [Willaertia magna]